MSQSDPQLYRIKINLLLAAWQGSLIAPISDHRPTLSNGTSILLMANTVKEQLMVVLIFYFDWEYYNEYLAGRPDREGREV